MFTQVWRNWQTRTVQVRVKAISCRFDSCYLHHQKYPVADRVFLFQEKTNSVVLLYYSGVFPYNGLKDCRSAVPQQAIQKNH